MENKLLRRHALPLVGLHFWEQSERGITMTTIRTGGLE